MSQTRKLLVCGVDANLRAALVEQLLIYEEFDILEAAAAAQVVDAMRSGQVDLIIMDSGLADMDGREAVGMMRREGFRSPIIMLTGQDSEAEAAQEPEAGANDHLTKPFRFAVLLARVRAHLRQFEASDSAVFAIGPYAFHPGTKLLVHEAGDKLRLTEKETAILCFLYRARQRMVPRDVLLQEVWGYSTNVTTHTLETHIYRLRRKIEADPARAKFLVTEVGGYKLVP